MKAPASKAWEGTCPKHGRRFFHQPARPLWCMKRIAISHGAFKSKYDECGETLRDVKKTPVA